MINHQPRDDTILVNQTAFFHCEASYHPAVDLTYDWYHNSYKIMFIKVRNLGNKVFIFTEPNYERVSWHESTKSSEIVQNERSIFPQQGTGIYRGSLYINNVQFYHAGDYFCVVKSTTQSIQSRARLYVEG